MHTRQNRPRIPSEARQELCAQLLSPGPLPAPQDVQSRPQHSEGTPALNPPPGFSAKPPAPRSRPISKIKAKKKKVRLDSLASSLASGEHRFQNVFAPLEHRRWEREPTQGPGALGPGGIFPADSDPHSSPHPEPGRGSPEKVMDKTDAAHESAFPRSLPNLFVQVVQKGTVGASKFPGAPPGRRLARSEVPWWRWLETWQGRKACSQHFLR